jgi:hypothetical protein
MYKLQVNSLIRTGNYPEMGARDMNDKEEKGRAQLWLNTIVSMLTRQILSKLGNEKQNSQQEERFVRSDLYSSKLFTLSSFPTNLTALGTPNREASVGLPQDSNGKSIDEPNSGSACSLVPTPESQGEIPRAITIIESESTQLISGQDYASADEQNKNGSNGNSGSVSHRRWGIYRVCRHTDHNVGHSHVPSPLRARSIGSRFGWLSGPLQELGFRGLRPLSLPLFTLLSLGLMALAIHFMPLGTLIKVGIVGLPMSAWTPQTGWVNTDSVVEKTTDENKPVIIEPTDSSKLNLFSVNKKYLPSYHVGIGKVASFGAEGWYDTKKQAVFREVNGEYRTVAFTGSRYTLLPNEVVAEEVDKWASEHGFTPQAKNSYTGSHGNAIFRTYLPSDEKLGSYYINQDKKDYIRLGFSVRNSIDESESCGVDSFSFRGLCTNGNIMRMERLEGMHKKHTPSLETVIKSLGQRIKDILDQGQNVVSFYQALARLEMRQQEAQALANTVLPDVYLPFKTEKVKEEGKPAQRIVLLADGKPVMEQDEPTDTDKGADLWSVFNNINGRVWHGVKRANPADMGSKNAYMALTNQTFRRLVSSRLSGEPQKGAP